MVHISDGRTGNPDRRSPLRERLRKSGHTDIDAKGDKRASCVVEIRRKRGFSARRYVYVWVDRVYLQARMEEAAESMLVLIGATPEGKKELVGFQTGVRESTQSWRELLRHRAAWARDCAGPGGRRRRARLREGDRRGLSRHQASALLGSQNRQRPEQGCPLGSAQHEGRHSRDLRRADPRSSRGGDRRVRRQIQRQV